MFKIKRSKTSCTFFFSEFAQYYLFCKGTIMSTFIKQNTPKSETKKCFSYYHHIYKKAPSLVLKLFLNLRTCFVITRNQNHVEIVFMMKRIFIKIVFLLISIIHYTSYVVLTKRKILPELFSIRVEIVLRTIFFNEDYCYHKYVSSVEYFPYLTFFVVVTFLKRKIYTVHKTFKLLS